jgi:hypothetical protein
MTDGEEAVLNIYDLDEDPIFDVMKFAIQYRIKDIALIELLRRKIERDIDRQLGRYKQKCTTDRKKSINDNSLYHLKNVYNKKPRVSSKIPETSQKKSLLSNLTPGSIKQQSSHSKSLSMINFKVQLSKGLLEKTKVSTPANQDNAVKEMSKTMIQQPPVVLEKERKKSSSKEPEVRVVASKKTSEMFAKLGESKEKEKNTGNEQVLEEIFQYLDSDKDGYISGETIDLDSITHISEDLLDAFQDVLGIIFGNEGEITCDEFIEMVKSSRSDDRISKVKNRYLGVQKA